MTKNTQQPKDPKASKRSVLGYCFNPDLGPLFTPMFESTRMFLHILAWVFSIYRLLPKDYPGLRDPNARLSLRHIIGTAWQNLRFTPEEAPRIILFFAIVGILAGGALAIFLLILSLFVGNAHAEGSSIFTPPDESTDLAYMWIKFIFLGGAYPEPGALVSGAAGMENPFENGSNSGLEAILPTMLAYYSDAILIAAAIILFYYLTSMVVETAHTGVAMGKRASQVWAPIRLVVAVGLLVPINGGLNSGQYIVIKMAEYGSGLATNMWNLMLDTIIAKNSKLVASPGPSSAQVATSIILMEACKIAWNDHAKDGAGVGLMSGPDKSSTTLGNRKGTKYSYSAGPLVDKDICGWYFIPDADGNGLLGEAIKVQEKAIADLRSTTTGGGGAAAKVKEVNSDAGDELVSALDAEFMKEVAAFQSSINSGMVAILSDDISEISAGLTAMKPLGWVMAGSYLNTINRIQGALTEAVSDSAPAATAPLIAKYLATQEDTKTDLWSQLWAGLNKGTWDVRNLTAKDMEAFSLYQAKSVSTAPDSGNAAQCAAMVGYTTDMFDWQTIGVGVIFGIIDATATIFGFWSGDEAHSCGLKSGLSTFRLGITIHGQDPFAQLSFLGHQAFAVGAGIIGAGILMQSAAAVLSALPTFSIAEAAQNVIAVLIPLMYFFAWLFWTMGFTLAFLIPLLPFMRFFFSVLSWFAGLAEAVVAVPLIALAHLNPEGDGLPGQAKTAYFYVFNLFLRPVLTIFGLILASILFLIAVSFLNYGYSVAIAGAGGTAFGLRAVSRIVYSVLYVATLYIAANNLFKLIDHLPEKALGWMGQSAQAMLNVGDYEDIEKTGAVVSSYAGQKGIDAMQNAGGGLNKLAQGWRDRDKPKNDAIASHAHTQGMTSDEFKASTDPKDQAILAEIMGKSGRPSLGKGPSDKMTPPGDPKQAPNAPDKNHEGQTSQGQNSAESWNRGWTADPQAQGAIQDAYATATAQDAKATAAGAKTTADNALGEAQKKT